MKKTMKKNIKSYSLLALSIALLIVLIPISKVNADNDTRLRSMAEIASRAVILHFNTEAAGNEVAVVKIRIRNKNTGAIMYQTYATRVNSDGKGRVMAKNLQPATPYDFKVKVRKFTLEDYGDYSNGRMISTQVGKSASPSTSSTPSDTSTDNSGSQ